MAVDYVWNSDQTGLWSVPANWTPNGIPGSADTATLGDTDVARLVTYDATAPATLGVVTVTQASAFANYLALAATPAGFTSITIAPTATGASAGIHLVDATALNVAAGSTLQFGTTAAAIVGGTVLDRTGTATGALAINGGTLLATSGNTAANTTFVVAAPATLSSGAINVVGPASGAQTQLQFTGSSFTMTGGTASIGSNANLILPSTNTLSAAGAITIASGGALTYGKMIDQTALNAINSTSSGFVLAAGTPTATTLDFTNAGTVSLGAASSFTLASTTTVTPNNGTYRFGGGAGTLTVQGALLKNANNLVIAGGRVNIGTSNGTYTGSTTINNGGTLVESAVGRIPAGTAMTVNGTGLLDLGVNAASKTATVSSLSGNGTVNITTAGSLSTTLLVSGTTDSIFSGQINDGGVAGAKVSFSKAGASRLTLSGTNGYTGTTALSAGTLAVTGSIANTAVTVTGGTLTGTGSVGTTSTVGLTGGTVAAGDLTGNGMLSVGSLSLGANAVDSVALNGSTAGQSSQLSVVSGGVTLAGTLQVAVNYAALVGDRFTIIQNTPAAAVSGGFSNVSGGVFTSGIYTFAVNYAANNENDVTLTVSSVPEPTAIGLLCVSGGLLARRRRAASR